MLAHRVSNFRSRGVWFVAGQCDRRHDVAGNAVSALHRLVLQERMLHFVQFFAGGQAFNRLNLIIANFAHRSNARASWYAVDEYRARTTLAFTAAVLGAGQMKSSRKTSNKGRSSSVLVARRSPLTVSTISLPIASPAQFGFPSLVSSIE